MESEALAEPDCGSLPAMRRIAVTLVVVGLACGGGEKKGDGGADVKAESKAQADPDPAAQEDPKPEEKGEEKAEQENDPKPSADTGGGAAPEWNADVEVLFELQGAQLRIAADRSGDDSIIWGQPVDAEGKAMSPATKLRGTKGSVESIDAVYDGRTVWVGWRSRVAEDRGLVGLAGFNAELAQMVEAQSLRFYNGGNPDPDGAIVLQPRFGGLRGVVVAALAGTKKCAGMFVEEEGKVDCTQLSLDLVSSDGKVEHSSVIGLEGGEPSLDDLVATEKGAAAAIHAWRGGPMTHVSYLADSGESEEAASCGYPPIDLAWAGGGLVSMCSDPDREEGDNDVCGPQNPGACGLINMDAVEGKPMVKKVPNDAPVTGLALRCDGKVELARVSWKGGSLELPARELGLHSKKGCPG